MSPHKHLAPYSCSLTKTCITLAFVMALVAPPAIARVTYEDDTRICFDNGRCNKKMTEEEMDAAAEYLSPDEQQEYQMLKDATRNPEALKKLLTTPYKPAVAP